MASEPLYLTPLVPFQAPFNNNDKGNQMKRVLLTLLSGGIIVAAGLNTAVAQDDDSDRAVPVELYICNYNDGMGPADLDSVTAKWNAWADGQGLTDYTAWTLTPFYYGDNQEFDWIWLGVAPTAQAMGAAQDDWVTKGGEVAAQFARLSTCGSHTNMASLQFKAPGERENPSSTVVSFSDCNIKDGKSFDDVAPAVAAWAEFRSGQGSKAGHYILFPAYGGGGEEFDFKYVSSHANFEEQGIDYDNYDPEKDSELFGDLLDCDSSRIYIAQNRRMAESDDE